MKTNLNTTTSELEIIVAAEKATWQKTQQNVEAKLIANLAIKGFRKGKVPVNIAKKHIAQSQITSESISKMLEPLAKKAATAIDKTTIVLSQPSYLVNKVSDAELEIKFIYPIYPKFKIGQYKNLDVKFEQEEVDDQKVNNEIERMRQNQAMLKDKTGKITKGDIAIIDFEGLVNNKPFEGGKSEKYELEIGSKQFVPGFEDQLIGLSPQTTKNIEVTFPKDYHDKKMGGKKAVFKVFIHNVKSKEIPTLNDEFVKTAGVPNVKTVSELKQYFQKILAKENRQAAASKFQRVAFDLIAKNTKDLVIPPVLIANEIKALRQQEIDNLQKQGISYKKYLEITGIKEEDSNVRLGNQAKVRLTDALLFAEIAKQEKITISENDYEDKYKQLAKIYSKSIEEIKKMITKEQMQIPITNERILELIIKNAKK